jgi:hypothetical protein
VRDLLRVILGGGMAKVELRYDLTAPLDDSMMAAIDRAHSVYGVMSVRVAPNLDSLLVLFDASRLTPTDVDEVLLRLGLPVRRSA